MRPSNIIIAVFFDVGYRAIGVGFAYYVGTAMTDKITALYSSISAALPG